MSLVGPLQWKQYVSFGLAGIGKDVSGAEEETDCLIARQPMTVWPDDTDL